jgi:hypothetical protein
MISNVIYLSIFEKREITMGEGNQVVYESFGIFSARFRYKNIHIDRAVAWVLE